MNSASLTRWKLIVGVTVLACLATTGTAATKSPPPSPESGRPAVTTTKASAAPRAAGVNPNIPKAKAGHDPETGGTGIAGTARAEISSIPGAHDPRAPTEWQFRREVFAFNLRTTVGAYKRVGHRDPKWDDLALKMIAGRAVIYTNYGAQWPADEVAWLIPNGLRTALVVALGKAAPAHHQRKTANTQTQSQAENQPAAQRAHDAVNARAFARYHSHAAYMHFLKQLNDTAEKLVKTPCDDPLALYCAMQMNRQNAADHLALARRVYDLMRKSDYPLFRKWAAAQYLEAQLRDNGKKREAKALRSKVNDLAVQVLTQRDLPADDQIFMRASLEEYLRDLPREQWKRICERAQATDSPYPWLVEELSGQYQIKAAWDARGSGWASTVTDRGWSSFFAHLDKAKTLLTAAWKRRPQWPQPATAMITVAMGTQAGLDRQRLWFDRAVAGRFDYQRAYSNYLWAIRPRWGGSHEMMYRFALACLNTGRFDTAVPSIFTDALWDIRNDTHNHTHNYTFWHRPGVYANFARCLDGLAKASKLDDRQRWYQSLKVAVAWRCGQFTQARQAMSKLGKRLDPQTFGWVDLEPDLGRPAVLAYSGAAGPALLRARSLLRGGRGDQAKNLLRDAAQKLAPDDPAVRYLHYAATMAQWAHRFNAGDWTPIIGDDLSGWHPILGQWKINDHNQIVGVSEKKGLMLKCRYRFGNHLEIQGRVTIKKFTGKYPDAGILFALKKPNNTYYLKWYTRYHRDVLFYPGLGVMLAHTFRWYDHKFHDKTIAKTFDFDIEQWQGKVHVTVNGKTIIKQAALPHWDCDCSRPLAIGAWISKPGSIIAFSNLRVRRIQQRPDWLGPEQAQPVNAAPAQPMTSTPGETGPPPAPGS